MEAVNVAGTRHLLGLLVEGGFPGVLHHVSSIAVAGDAEGRFTEDQLDVGQRLVNPYFRTKHDSEALVRAGPRSAGGSTGRARSSGTR